MKKDRKMIIAAAGALASAAFYVFSGEIPAVNAGNEGGIELVKSAGTDAVSGNSSALAGEALPGEQDGSCAGQARLSEEEAKMIRDAVSEALAEELSDEIRSAVREALEEEIRSLSETGRLSEAVTEGVSGYMSLVNINTADKSRFMELPGIGEVKAKNIVKYREEHGNFQSIDELMSVDGISASLLEKIRDEITV